MSLFYKSALVLASIGLFHACAPAQSQPVAPAVAKVEIAPVGVQSSRRLAVGSAGAQLERAAARVASSMVDANTDVVGIAKALIDG